MRDPLREAARWLHQAQTDLGAAHLLTDGFPALACFHAQQAAEKALKAVLYAAGNRPVLGHAIAELGQEVEARDPSFAQLRAEAARLDRYYIPTRYRTASPRERTPTRLSMPRTPGPRSPRRRRSSLTQRPS